MKYEDVRIKVVGSSSAVIFEDEIQKAVNKFTEKGYKVEIQTHVHNAHSLAAVVIARKSVNPLEVKVNVDLEATPIAKGTMAYSNGLDYKREHEEKLPKFLKEMQADKAAMDFYKHGTLPSQQDKEQK